MGKLFRIIILLSFLYNQARGDDFLPYFDKVTPINGNIYCIHQDSKGYIWVGSKKGVVRYDGANFDFYHTQDSLIPPLAQVFQLSLSQGETWA